MNTRVFVVERVIIRALGPSVPVPGTLSDPMLELYGGYDTLMRSNDNWKDAANASEISATGIAPTINSESAVLQTLGPGRYTAIVQSANGTTGIGLADVYKLDN